MVIDDIINTWTIVVFVIGAITLLWNFRKTTKEIKETIEKPIVDLTAKVDNIDTKLDEHIRTSDEAAAKTMRNRILRFSDEIVANQEHTKEHYEDVLSTIDAYEKYCLAHPTFKNNTCLMAIANIKDAYKYKLKNKKFVNIERLVDNSIG